MISFDEFLDSRLSSGGFSTEDVLVSFLPLARRVVQVHAAGNVAPLKTVGHLHADALILGFSDRDIHPPQLNLEKVERLDRPRGALEIVSEINRHMDVRHGTAAIVDMQLGEKNREPSGPVYVAGYYCWEHLVEHHDPLTDIFSLGLILASIACSLNLNNTADLTEFVTHRRNLFRIMPGLHPVLSKAIIRMTELSRHARS